MIKKSEEESDEKLSDLNDPKHIPGQFISLDLDNKHPTSKEAIGCVAGEVGLRSSDKTSGFGDGRDEGFLGNRSYAYKKNE
ncbi:hypothetical protein Tco_0157376 [Tanacetum coccineum]